MIQGLAAFDVKFAAVYYICICIYIYTHSVVSHRHTLSITIYTVMMGPIVSAVFATLGPSLSISVKLGGQQEPSLVGLGVWAFSRSRDAQIAGPPMLPVQADQHVGTVPWHGWCLARHRS